MLSLFRANAEASAQLHVAADLVYTTDASCRAITQLPSTRDALATRLLPERAAFRGNLQLSKAASGDGCALYLTVKGAVSAAGTDFQDAFDVTRSVHHQLTQLLADKGLQNVALSRVSVALDGDKLLAASLQSEDVGAATESVLTLQRGACTELVQTLETGDVELLLPRQVQTESFDLIRQGDADESSECAVDLEMAAVAPQVKDDDEVFQLLKAVDEKVETFFAARTSTTLTSANVRLHVASTSGSVEETLSVQTESADAMPTNVTYNAPSYEEALGIFALVAVLVAMMMGVVVQKKRNEQRSRERYDRANRAAQIRRVSIRMSQYDHEESQDIDGEQDSLL